MSIYRLYHKLDYSPVIVFSVGLEIRLSIVIICHKQPKSLSSFNLEFFRSVFETQSKKLEGEKCSPLLLSSGNLNSDGK